MSLYRTLIVCLLLLLLSGCDLLPADPSQRPLKPLGLMSVQSFNEWLAVSYQLREVDPQQAEEELALIGSPKSEAELFHYGLLNQQLNRLEGWIQARDSFRTLAQSTTLEQGFRELARIYQVHNQALINWHERHRSLQHEVVATMLEREALEKKIRALTELEETISDQKQRMPAPEENTQ